MYRKGHTYDTPLDTCFSFKITLVPTTPSQMRPHMEHTFLKGSTTIGQYNYASIGNTGLCGI